MNDKIALHRADQVFFPEFSKSEIKISKPAADYKTCSNPHGNSYRSKMVGKEPSEGVAQYPKREDVQDKHLVHGTGSPHNPVQDKVDAEERVTQGDDP